MSAPPTQPMIAVTGLHKSYGDQRVLDGLDLAVAEGSVYALLGPNGAGKTTAVRILSTLISPDRGQLRVAGHDVLADPAAVRSVIGVTGQFSAVDNLLTGRENLQLMADLNHLAPAEGRRRGAELLARFDLVEAADRIAAGYSGGMRRRLDLAMTLIGAPRVIFLDEPTTGLDPRSRHTMWQIIRDLVREQGVTLFLTTQYLEEADQLADRIGVLDHGSLVAEGTAEELKRRIPGGFVRLRFPGSQELAAASRVFPAGVPDPAALTLQIPGDGGVPELRALLDRLAGHAIEVDRLTVHTPDLDDVFFALTGHPASTDKEPAR